MKIVYQYYVGTRSLYIEEGTQDNGRKTALRAGARGISHVRTPPHLWMPPHLRTPPYLWTPPHLWMPPHLRTPPYSDASPHMEDAKEHRRVREKQNPQMPR